MDSHKIIKEIEDNAEKTIEHNRKNPLDPKIKKQLIDAVAQAKEHGGARKGSGRP